MKLIFASSEMNIHVATDIHFPFYNRVLISQWHNFRENPNQNLSGKVFCHVLISSQSLSCWGTYKKKDKITL